MSDIPGLTLAAIMEMEFEDLLDWHEEAIRIRKERLAPWI